MILLDLDLWTAAHLAAAIRVHREAMRRNYAPTPDGLEKIERACAARCSAVPGGEDPVTQATRLHDASMTALLLSLDDTARVLGGVSQDTVKRLIREGELPGVKIRNRTFIHRDDLEQYVDSLRHTATTLRTPERSPA